MGTSRSAVGTTSAVRVTTTGRPSATTTAAVERDTVGTTLSATATASTTAAAVVTTSTVCSDWSPPVVGRAGPIRTDTAFTGPTV